MSYLSAEQLDITKEERNGLVWLINRINDKSITLASKAEVDNAPACVNSRIHMGTWESGNIRCIGGWMESKKSFPIVDVNTRVYDREYNFLYTHDNTFIVSPVLANLLFPREKDYSLEDIRKAILNFLQNGVVKWHKGYICLSNTNKVNTSFENWFNQNEVLNEHKQIKVKDKFTNEHGELCEVTNVFVRDGYNGQISFRNLKNLCTSATPYLGWRRKFRMVDN